MFDIIDARCNYEDEEISCLSLLEMTTYVHILTNEQMFTASNEQFRCLKIRSLWSKVQRKKFIPRKTCSDSVYTYVTGTSCLKAKLAYVSHAAPLYGKDTMHNTWVPPCLARGWWFLSKPCMLLLMFVKYRVNGNAQIMYVSLKPQPYLSNRFYVSKRSTCLYIYIYIYIYTHTILDL